MWCRTSKTSSDAVVFFLLKATYSELQGYVGGFTANWRSIQLQFKLFELKLAVNLKWFYAKRFYLKKKTEEEEEDDFIFSVCSTGLQS